MCRTKQFNYFINKFKLIYQSVPYIRCYIFKHIIFMNFSLPPLCFFTQLPPLRQGLLEQSGDEKTQPGDTPTMFSMETPKDPLESKDSLCPLNITESMQPCNPSDTGRLRLTLALKRLACPPRTTWLPRLEQCRGPGAMPDAEWS